MPHSYTISLEWHDGKWKRKKGTQKILSVTKSENKWHYQAVCTCWCFRTYDNIKTHEHSFAIVNSLILSHFIAITSHTNGILNVIKIKVTFKLRLKTCNSYTHFMPQLIVTEKWNNDKNKLKQAERKREGERVKKSVLIATWTSLDKLTNTMCSCVYECCPCSSATTVCFTFTFWRQCVLVNWLWQYEKFT